MISRTLYKYLPSEFVDTVRTEGKLLFRNLSYFKQIEDKVRGDDLEGIHQDKGLSGDGFDVILEDGTKLKGLHFKNSIDSDKVFVFCLSTVFDEKLFDEFECDACIKINDVAELINRCVLNIRKRTDTDELYYGNVEYYEFNKKTKGNIKNPKHIPLFKHSRYKDHNEFRMYFAIEDGFTLKQVVTIKGNPFNLPEDKTTKSKPTSKDILIDIGNIEPFTEVIYKKIKTEHNEK